MHRLRVPLTVVLLLAGCGFLPRPPSSSSFDAGPSTRGGTSGSSCTVPAGSYAMSATISASDVSTRCPWIAQHGAPSPQPPSSVTAQIGSGQACGAVTVSAQVTQSFSCGAGTCIESVQSTSAQGDSSGIHGTGMLYFEYDFTSGGQSGGGSCSVPFSFSGAPSGSGSGATGSSGSGTSGLFCSYDGNACSAGSECCSGLCANGLCTSSSTNGGATGGGTTGTTGGSCNPYGTPCGSGAECCSGLCTTCKTNGYTCATSADCCSGYCRPPASQFDVATCDGDAGTPIGGMTCGCKSTGYTCATSAECCTGYTCSGGYCQ